MDARVFEAGTIAVLKDDRLVLRQGYGWRNEGRTIRIHPDNLFRLASVSKTITGTAIQKLVGEGRLSLTTKVYALLGITPWRGVLGDSRIADITVQQLLDHKGGWDAGVSPFGDLVFRTISISEEMGLNHPANPTEVMSWAFSKPLDFTPGSRTVYSNFGYLVLGRVVEKVSGKSFAGYVQDDLLGPFGVTSVIQSRSRPVDRAPAEIWYADSSRVRSAVDFPTNITVRDVDGGLYYESFDSFGGLTASAGGLCGYMRNYWVAGVKRAANVNYAWNYVFYGSLPGTTTVIHQDMVQNGATVSGLEFVALFNRRTGGGDDNDVVHTAIANAAATVSSWPVTGGGAVQWNSDIIDVGSTASSVTVQLIRTSGSSLPIKVTYTTYAATSQFVPSAGTVTFASGETSKEVSIALTPSTQGAERTQFQLELISAAGGAWLGDRVSSTVNIVPRHSADCAPTDGRISLSELLRVIELYQAHSGTIRTGRYAAASTASIDGYEPDNRTPSGTGTTVTRFHSADTNHDGRLSLEEVTRVIELYSARIGASRTGEYHSQTGTEDGFSTGP